MQSEILDRPVSFPRRAGLTFHLMVCKWCRRYGKQIRLLRSLAQGHSDELANPLPHKLSAEASERIKQKLRQGQ